MRPLDLLAASEHGRYVTLPGSDVAAEVPVVLEGWQPVHAPGADDGTIVAVVPVDEGGAVGAAVDRLAQLSPSAVLVLLPGPPSSPGVEQAVTGVAAAGFEVARVEELDDEPWGCGVLLTPAPDEAAEGTATLVRRARTVLAGRRAEGEDHVPVAALQRRLRSIEEARARESARSAGLARDVERLERELAEERRRLTDVERSTSYRLGRAVVQSARDPRQVPRHGRELLDRWRKRGSGSGATGTRTASLRPDLPPLGGRSPIPTTVPAVAAPDRAVPVAGVLADRTAAALATEVLLTRLLPHDAAQLVAATSPAVVVIDSEASAAGGPWVGAGSGAVPARDRELVDLLRAADQVGAATVLLWSGPRWRAPGLRAIAERCTVEVAADDVGFGWVLGVPPAAIARHPVSSEAGDLAALDLRGDLRLPRGLDARVAVERPSLGSQAATDPWAVWGDHAAWLVPATGPDRWQATAAAIAGATPVVTVSSVPDDLAAIGATHHLDGDHDDGGDRWVAPTWAQRRHAVLTGGVHATLAALGDLLGRELVVPPSRSVAVHLAGVDASHVDLLLDQIHLPAGSVVVSADPLSDRTIDALTARGHRTARWVPADVRFSARLDPTRHGPTHLADLLAGWELTRTAVVVAGATTDLGPAGTAEVDAADVLIDLDAAGTSELRDLPATVVPSEVRP